MPKKRIYIAGKITGLSRNTALTLFGNIERQLIDKYMVVNPLRIVPAGCKSHALAMRICVKELMTCHVAVFLPNWVDSKGAQMEWQICEWCGIPRMVAENGLANKYQIENLLK